jgi:hemoglobin/transferrin/lactoferrin receptor protein
VGLKRLAAIFMAGTALVFVSSLAARAQDAGAAQSEETASDGATKLKRLVITSSPGDGEITDTAAPVSEISAEDFQQRYSGNINTALRAKAGTFTREGAEQPGVVVNVRGMQGMGRVNTMIDGVPQTFRNLSGHGGSFDNMAYVDPNMLAGAEISRGSVSGAEGLGTLSGSANLRTVGIDDVLLEGKNEGLMTTLRTGTNGYYFSRLTAAGIRRDVGDGGDFSVIGAVSGSNFGNYQNGDGQDYPYNAAQQPRSALMKVKLAPDDTQSLELGGVYYKNAFDVGSAGYRWHIENQTYSAKYAYAPGDDLIDLKINAYANFTDVRLNSISQYSTSFDGREGRDTGLGIDASNTSLVDLGAETELKLFYGAAVNSDQYKGNEKSGANPDGKLIKSGAFTEATLTHGMFGLNTALRYDHYALSGVASGASDDCANGYCGGDAIDRSGGKWNPKIGGTFSPTDWAQFYVTYAHTMRPPTTSELFYPGGHNFDGIGDPINNNPNLVPEEQKGFDIGVNLMGEGLLISTDKGHLKIGYFRNRIENYITYGYDSNGDAKWINLNGETVMQGVEIEGGYDAGRVYANFSLTIADTDQPIGVGAGFGNDVGTLPDDFGTLDVGTRFLEEKLTLGGRVRYVGDSIQAYMTEEQSLERPSYTLVDLYGSYKISKNFETFFTVENLFDKAYWTANTGTGDILSGITNGRGRTIMLGATARF